MELCTSTQLAIFSLPNNNHHHRSFPTCPSLLRPKSVLSLKQIPVFRSGYGLRSRTIYYINPLPRATSSEETSSGGDKRDGAIIVEDVPAVEKNVYNESVLTVVPKEESPVAVDRETSELLEKLNIKFDSEDTYLILLYGSGALLALWLASGVVGAIDSIPLFPKLMEVVGLGYTFWFTSRYVLFKKDRDELIAKIEELKQRVLGTNDD